MEHETLAQQALALLDERGEYALLPFLMDHHDPEAHPGWWREHGVCYLLDGSTVEHESGEYAFAWQDGEVFRRHARPSAMPDHGRPDPSNRPRPALVAPTLGDVLARVVHVAERRLGLDLDEAALDTRRARLAAPSLYRAVESAVDRNGCGRYIEKYEDNILDDLALAAIAILPEDEWDAIRDAVRVASEPRASEPAIVQPATA